MKNNEKKWKPMKNDEKYNKNNETYGKKSTQWKASKYIILEPCHARVSKIFYLVRFRIF